MFGGFGIEAHAEPDPALAAAVKPASADRWAELAAAHAPEMCARCRPQPQAPVSVADVVRRMRRDATPAEPEPVRASDVAADLKHVAATAADDQSRQAMRIADELARGDVREAASFAAALPGRVQYGALLVVLYVWTRQDRSAALDWTQALSDEATRDVAVDEVTRRLVAADAREAVALVSGLPAGPAREDALCSVARHWAKIDRAAALGWAHGLADSATKTRILSAPEFAAETE